MQQIHKRNSFVITIYCFEIFCYTSTIEAKGPEVCFFSEE